MSSNTSSAQPSAEILEQLYHRVAQRKNAPASESYSAALLAEAPENRHESLLKKQPRLL